MNFDNEIDERIREIEQRPELIRRYDVTGDGRLDKQEWQLVRRMVRLELKTAHERGTTWDLDTEPDVFHGRYEVVGLLGRGGQAFTYLALDLEEDQHVVVKELSLHVAADWKSVELFDREAEVLERLDHPAIPTYVDAFHIDAPDGTVRFMLVQEFVDGEDLSHFVERGGRWDELEALQRIWDLCDVLEYLHELPTPVVHRDIKPSNIIVDRHGDIRLVDFGAVQTIVPNTVGGSTIIGTTGYVPMEQYMGRATAASDVYALGATAIHMLTGMHPADLPFENGRLEFKKHLNGTGRLIGLLDAMVEPVLEKRLQSAADVQTRIGTRPTEPIVQNATERELERTPKPPRRRHLRFHLKSEPTHARVKDESGETLGFTPLDVWAWSDELPVEVTFELAQHEPYEFSLDRNTSATTKVKLRGRAQPTNALSKRENEVAAIRHQHGLTVHKLPGGVIEVTAENGRRNRTRVTISKDAATVHVTRYDSSAVRLATVFALIFLVSSHYIALTTPVVWIAALSYVFLALIPRAGIATRQLEYTPDEPPIRASSTSEGIAVADASGRAMQVPTGLTRRQNEALAEILRKPWIER